MFSRSMQRCAVQLPGKGEALRRNDYTWEILEAGAAEPLLTLPDARMLTLSPDGEYLVAQAPEEYAELIHITSGESLHVFPLDRHNFRVYAAFAPDSRTLAVYGGFDAYTVVRISETGCTETPLEFRIGIWLSSQCFSPDGTRLLSATCGKAWLHDTTTGRLLHTLTEPQQLRSQHVGTPEVLGIKMPFVNYLGDLAGNFTNLANSEPSLSAAFIEDGAWALTVAEAQMIRVWDCRTGRSVHTIDMGLSNTRNENGVMENGVLLSGNGAYAFACNANDSQAILWDVNSGAVARKYTDWNREYRVKHVSDDGKSIYLNINGSLYWLHPGPQADGAIGNHPNAVPLHRIVPPDDPVDIPALARKEEALPPGVVFHTLIDDDDLVKARVCRIRRIAFRRWAVEDGAEGPVALQEHRVIEEVFLPSGCAAFVVHAPIVAHIGVGAARMPPGKRRVHGGDDPALPPIFGIARFHEEPEPVRPRVPSRFRRVHGRPRRVGLHVQPDDPVVIGEDLAVIVGVEIVLAPQYHLQLRNHPAAETLGVGNGGPPGGLRPVPALGVGDDVLVRVQGAVHEPKHLRQGRIGASGA